MKDSKRAQTDATALRNAPVQSREFFAYEPHSIPDGMRVRMPDEAEASEHARRRLLDFYHHCGYRLVEPPIVDSIESLCSSASPELKQKTMRLTDPADARPMGIRADITPQIARIDARQMDHAVPQRYAYCGDIIHAERDHVGADRNLSQIGVELFGADSLSADQEIIELAIETCRMMSFGGLVLDIGHMEVFERLFIHSGLHPGLRHPLYSLMQNKSERAVDDFLSQYDTSAQNRRLYTEAVRLHGDTDVIARARQLLGGIDGIDHALAYLAEVVQALSSSPTIDRISIDLIGTNSYSYELGLVFELYSPQAHGWLIRGGRYNDFGDTFGRGRSAIGFSGGLNDLTALQSTEKTYSAVYAPYIHGDARLSEAVQRLRASNTVVVCGLTEAHNQHRLGCHQELVLAADGWQVRACAATH